VYSPFPDRGEPLTKPVELPQGTLEMLILKAVSLGPLHGYGILLRIQQISGERLEILQGSFYTAIYRLERRGWIKGEWGESENNRRARFYSLTLAGTRQLKAETAKWTDMAAVVGRVAQKRDVESVQLVLIFGVPHPSVLRVRVLILAFSSNRIHSNFHLSFSRIVRPTAPRPISRMLH
jgi:PadR family transcriptional regulator, regulatory protein PadR